MAGCSSRRRLGPTFHHQGRQVATGGGTTLIARVNNNDNNLLAAVVLDPVSDAQRAKAGADKLDGPMHPGSAAPPVE